MSGVEGRNPHDRPPSVHALSQIATIVKIVTLLEEGEHGIKEVVIQRS